jgi:hypothetical protein
MEFCNSLLYTKYFSLSMVICPYLRAYDSESHILALIYT